MEKYGYRFCLFFLMTFAFVFGYSPISFALGVATPEYWVGTYAVYYDNSTAPYGNVDMEENYEANVNSTGTGPFGSVSADPYSLHGLITDGAVGISGFQDEIYFDISNNNPIAFSLNFDISIDFSVFTNTKSAEGWVGMRFWAGHENVDFASILFEGAPGNYTASFYHSSLDNPDQTWLNIEGLEFNQTVSFSTAGVLGSQRQDGGLVDSNTYLPITFEIEVGSLNQIFDHKFATFADNVDIDWLNSFNLNPYNPVSLYQNGVLLSPGEYELASLQGNHYIQPVPEPATMLLLGAGLLGLAGLKRKFRK